MHKFNTILASVILFFPQGCAPLLIGGLIGAGAAKAHSKNKADRLQQELLALEQDYSDGKISRDAYWQSRAKLVSELRFSRPFPDNPLINRKL